MAEAGEDGERRDRDHDVVGKFSFFERLFGAGRLHMTVEEHGAGRQLVRFRCWPCVSPIAACTTAVLVLAAAIAVARGSVAPAKPCA